MADRKQTEVSKIDALYNWLSYDLQRMKGELLKELKYSSVQVGSLYQEIKSDEKSTAQAITQEIRYSYKQNQNIYDGLATMLAKVDEKISSVEEIRALNERLEKLLSEEVSPKLDAIEEKEALLEQIEAAIVELNEKFGESDMKKLAEAISEKTEESLSDHNRQVLDAVAAIPVAENVDYTRIVDEVGDRVLEVLCDIKNSQPAVEPVSVDYDKIVGGTAEKVVESLPYPEKIDYQRISDIVEKAAASAVEKALSALNVDALADLVAAKLATSEKRYEIVLDEAGVDQLADKVAAKLAVGDSIDYDKVCQAAQAAQILPDPVDYDRIAEIVEDKIESAEEPTYDLVIDDEGINAIARSVSEKICEACNACEDEVSVTEAVEEVAEEAPVEEAVEEVVEEAPVEEAIEEVVEEAPVEEAVEEVVEEAPVEEVVEEVVEEAPVEEAVEEVVEEAPVEEAAEEVVEEAPVEEVAEVAEEEPIVNPFEGGRDEAPVESEAIEEIALSFSSDDLQEINNQLVDAETGLVIRLKRSFTAKMKQSDEKVKGYYSDIKNELTSYKKINSNVSWLGDRFNYGRDTIAKINICGKTLCFYVALDPNDPEYKTTVYHQKDVSGQKAYENTPFMVKVKSDAAAKKALRLVGFLAGKIGTEKKEDFETVDYVEEFAYQSTKQLYEDGFIKATKEKKVDLDF